MVCILQGVLDVVLDPPLLLLVLLPLHPGKAPAHRVLVLVQCEVSKYKNIFGRVIQTGRCSRSLGTGQKLECQLEKFVLHRQDSL